MKTLTAALALPALIGMSGCLRGASAVKELAEDAVAEALITQSISSYNEVALNVSVNDRSVDMACNTGGTVTWEELESNDEICYQVDSRGCDFETGNSREFSIEGSSSLCGSDSFAINESTLQSGQSYTISGTSTVASGDSERTCSYSLDVSVDSVLGDGATYNVSVSGNLCGSRGYAGSFEVAVEGNIEASVQ